MAFWSKKEEAVRKEAGQQSSQPLNQVKEKSAFEASAPAKKEPLSASKSGLAPKAPEAQAIGQALVSNEVSPTSVGGLGPQTLEQRFGKLRSALGPGTVIQGKLSFDTPVRIDGKLSGEVFSSSALIIGEAGVVDAKIEAQSLIILGKVKGQVKAEKLVELHSSGSFDGDLDSPSFVMQSGSTFNGSCTMGFRSEKPEPKLKAPLPKGPVIKAGEHEQRAAVSSQNNSGSSETSSEKPLPVH